ncbi:MAG: type II restriction endonuclease [Aestuariivirga sp.]
MSTIGKLASCFSAAGAKRLSAVEASPQDSNQHEFNGTAAFKLLFGTDDKRHIPTTFIWLNDHNEGIAEQGFVTWYDSRRNHPTRSEFRLYYPTNAVSELMRADDILFLALRPNGDLLAVVTPSQSEISSQVAWLLGLNSQPSLEFEAHKIQEGLSLDFASRFILDELGLDLEIPEADRIDDLLKQLGATLPSTKVMSEFARKTVFEKVSAIDDPDHALMTWLDHEEKLFRRHEHFRIASFLENGLISDGKPDVDSFLKFSLSIQNSRKSRMGHALENHLENIFVMHKLEFTRGHATERKNKPDFIFPSIDCYRELNFPSSKLTMLASKSTCKDRWRQVLSEADRIPHKHLITLEPSISKSQTDEMAVKLLQLVVPRSIFSSYRIDQQTWLMNVGQFINLASSRVL